MAKSVNWATVKEVELPKTLHTKVVVSHTQSSRGVDYIGIREWFNTEGDATWRPTPKGINLPFDMASSVAKALIEAST